MPPEFRIVANPTSGRQRAPALAQRVLELLIRHGRTADLWITEAHGDAAKKAAAAVAEGVEVVVACGGDGTLSEVAGALLNSGSKLGILPGGRCNDLARVFGIHKSQGPEELTEILVGKQTAKMDLGLYEGKSAPGTGDDSGSEDPMKGCSIPRVVKPGGRPFCTVATLGLDSRVSRYVEQHRLRLKGAPAYLYALLRVLLKLSPLEVRLYGDFGSFEGRIVMAATCNTAYYGGGIKIAPAAIPTDGVFDLCLLSELPRASILKLLPQVFRGAHVKHPAVRMLRTSFLEIEVLGGAEWICADGESLGVTPSRLSVLPRAVEVKTSRLFK